MRSNCSWLTAFRLNRFVIIPLGLLLSRRDGPPDYLLRQLDSSDRGLYQQNALAPAFKWAIPDPNNRPGRPLIRQMGQIRLRFQA
jgi:hypothetical protein